MRTPDLIQRCEVTGKYKQGQKVSEFISLDYMGSTEFELGDFGKRMREISTDEASYEIFRVKNEYGLLWVLAKEEQKSVIVEFLTAHMREAHPQEYNTKESTYIYDALHGNKKERLTSQLILFRTLCLPLVLFSPYHPAPLDHSCTQMASTIARGPPG